MAFSNKPVFVATPKEWRVRISTANSGRDGSGTTGTLVTAGANGSRVERITVTATVTTTAGMVRLFLSDGTNIRAFIEVPIAAVTPSASAAAFTAEVARTDGQPICNLPAGWLLLASTHNAEQIDVSGCGGDY